MLYFVYELVSHETASSSAECSRDKPPFSFVRGQDSTNSTAVWEHYDPKFPAAIHLNRSSMYSYYEKNLFCQYDASPDIFFTGADRQNSFTSPDDVCLVRLATQFYLHQYTT